MNPTGLHDYHVIIKRPMDLGTVKKKMDARSYGDQVSMLSKLSPSLLALRPMEQRTLRTLNNNLNTNIYSYLETSRGKSFNLYVN